MAAYAALVSLINNIAQIIAHPRLSNCFELEQIQSLQQKAGSLLEFIEGGYNHEDLEREITSAAHAAEDVIESHVVDQIHAGTLCSLDLQQVIQDMVAVAGKAMGVKEREGVREKADQPPIRHPTPHAVETAMVGLEDELNQLLSSLTDDHSNRHVISIVGMGGTGKTTLAQNLYLHQVIKEHFDIRGWATISQQYRVEDILSQLLLSCLGDKFTKGNVGELGQQLHRTLLGKRYLIVLDDIWDVEAWDRVRRYLPDGNDSSRVVLSTRLSNLASDCGSTCIDINLLDEDKSWKLFCEKTLFPLKDDPPQLQDVAKNIVKHCKGLALSIVVIGGLLLSSPRSVEYWENVLKGLEKNDDSKEKEQGLDALFLSYNHLPPHLKPCFLYMGTFKEDSRIRASDIIRLWVAEGFIKPKGTRFLEEIAEDHLKDLSDRNLVLGMERRLTGKIKSFSIHDLLRDLCIKVGEQQEFFHVWKPNQILSGTVRRIVCYEQFTKESGPARARSLLGWDYSLENGKHRLLRVFDAVVNKLPEDVYGNNVNLRYLHVYKLLSSNICLVWNLQTLIIEEFTFRENVAPREIWKMRQLRHVKGSQLYLPDPPRDTQDRMEQLQTLRTVVNLRLSEETCEIIPNIKKLGLIYDAGKRGYDDSLIECLRNLDRFHKLESLSMEIMTSKWPYQDPDLSSMLAFPRSLKKLRLSECMLHWEDLSVIGSLPQLQLLYLNVHAVMAGRLWSPVGGQFPCLKLLVILNCDLFSWDADCSHFPVLEKLILINLSFLEEIPLEIGGIPTLELIRVEYCTESAAISAVRIKKDQLENYDNDALQIEIKVYDLESFNESMETEDLTLDLLNNLT